LTFGFDTAARRRAGKELYQAATGFQAFSITEKELGKALQPVTGPTGEMTRGPHEASLSRKIRNPDIEIRNKSESPSFE
jgi:hypothetical protein